MTTLQNEVEGVSQVLYNAPEPLTEGSDQAIPGHITVFSRRGRRALPDVIRLLNHADIEVDAVEVREPDLEAVFLALTGRALRD